MENIEKKSTSLTIQRFLLIRVGDRKFGLSLDSVREAIGMRPFTPVPCSVPHFLGLVSLRDLVVPLIDLAARLGLPSDAHASDPNDSMQGIVVCKTEEGEEYFGLVVDDIDSVIALEPTDLMPPPRMGVDEGEGQYIRGVTRIDNQLVLLLNPNMVVNSKDLSAFGKMSAA